jgi:hypothetical protein
MLLADADWLFPSTSVAATLFFGARIVRDRSGQARGVAVQTAQPRDVGALAFVVGLFLILFVVTVMLPAGR